MKKALIVLHQKSSEAGNLENKLIERKFDLEFICPALGDNLPQNLEHYGAIIILGGPMSANDNDDFMFWPAHGENESGLHQAAQAKDPPIPTNRAEATGGSPTQPDPPPPNPNPPG